ncbi:OmpA family protein [Roseiterribacter gracilis]|uniref:Membrane protein n=1 Tax=Roseiterribacter gracilis TaxID=2812848 RepID=A0A8S8X5R5_9PROT|nr:membrane protein [Rhodospirillales bacterium TMPK1]
MQRRFALTLLTAALLAGTAQAQQSSSSSSSSSSQWFSSTPTPGTFNWSGLYGGINGGFSPSIGNKIETQGVGANAANVLSGRRPGSITNDREGAVAGGQVGFNWQTGNIVYGAEADFDWADLNHTQNYYSALNDRAQFNQHQYTLGTVRARVGYAFDRWLPYVTGGWAYGRYSNGANFYSNAPGTPLAFTGNQSGFGSGWTAGGGVEYAIPTNTFSMFGNAVTLRAEYLYYDLGERTIGVNGATGGYASKFENKGQVARLGLNFKFGGPAVQTATVQQASYTPPPAQRAQAPRSYLVFFDFDRSDLTPEASNIVKTAADNAKSGNVTRIDVTGHADRSGSDQYNLRLSQRRAQTVQAELVRDGIPADQISVSAKGESEPLVPTADGVREPQNRRVEIVYR